MHFRSLNAAACSAAVTAFLWYAFAGIPLHLAVAARLGLTAEQTGSWILVVWLTSAVASVGASLYYRMPIPITWTIPGMVYLGALAGRFTYAEIVGANLLAGVLMVALGAAGVGRRVMTWFPLPIVMGMFAGSMVGYGTRLVSATLEDALVAGTCAAAYFGGRVLNDKRFPPVGLAALAGAAALLLRLPTPPALTWSVPVLAVPEMHFGLAPFAAVSLPMIILSLVLGNVQGLGFLKAQGYAAPVDAVSTLVGVTSAANAIFGGHPAILARTGVAILAGKEAGPPQGRYWAVVISAGLTLLIAFSGTSLAALVGVLPRSYLFALAGLAILGALQDALEKAFSASLRFGALVALLVALTPFAILGISSAFWAVVAGLGASALLEREELLTQWRS